MMRDLVVLFVGLCQFAFILGLYGFGIYYAALIARKGWDAGGKRKR